MTTKNDDTTVREWLTMLRIATDADSPFAGMVDLTGIFALPLYVQQRIHDAMTPAQLDRLRELYGAPKKDAVDRVETPRDGGR